MFRSLVAAALLALPALPAAAQLDPLSFGEDHFIGRWSVEGAGGCASGAGTLTFYRSGVWIFVENPAERPFETIGSWFLVAEGLAMRASDHGRPGDVEEAIMPLLAAEEGRIELEDSGRAMAFERCG